MQRTEKTRGQNILFFSNFFKNFIFWNFTAPVFLPQFSSENKFQIIWATNPFYLIFWTLIMKRDTRNTRNYHVIRIFLFKILPGYVCLVWDKEQASRHSTDNRCKDYSFSLISTIRIINNEQKTTQPRIFLRS